MDIGSDDAIDVALSSRRMAHGRSSNGKGRSGRGKGGAASKPFNPLRALGTYGITLGSKGRNQTASGTSAKPDDQPCSLEIHELTPNEDGLLGTFNFVGQMNGILVMAGSRKGLADIIQDFETEEGESDDTESDAEDGDEDKDASEQKLQDDSRHGSEEEESAEEQPIQGEIELEDERINRRFAAFEKNSFKNPKFWFRYKAYVGKDGFDQAQETRTREIEVNTGYLIFTSNDCDQFDATISSSYHGWKDIKMTGRKIRPQATACPLSWNDVDIEKEVTDEEEDEGGQETGDGQAVLET